MKLASYNVENLFLRARALNMASWSDGQPAIDRQKRLNALLNKETYSPANKAKILTLLTELGLDKRDDGGDFAVLRQNHGKLLTRPLRGRPRVVANGRADWIGWVDLKTEEVNEVATRMTARVLVELDADVIAVVEAESRHALLRFSDNLLPEAGGQPYDQVMLIDGNDERGIDVGLMTRGRHKITSMVSHVDDRDQEGARIFSRDCPVYCVVTPAGNEVYLHVNHFKSKIGGGDAKRLQQAQRVKKIYRALRKAGHSLVAVLGDLNDSPDSAQLRPLLEQTDLRDISEHESFDDGAGGTRPGTFGSGTARNKIDYVLMSPEMFGAVESGGIFRRGVWAGANGDIFADRYEEITKPAEAASDHAAIWADVSV